jgi:hypothetical protein
MASLSLYLPWADTARWGVLRGYQAPTALYPVPLAYPFLVATFGWRMWKWLAIVCVVLAGGRAAYHVIELAESSRDHAMAGLYVFLAACVVMFGAIPMYRKAP